MGADGPELLGEVSGRREVALPQGQGREELAGLLEVGFHVPLADPEGFGSEPYALVRVALVHQAGCQGDLGLGMVGGRDWRGNGWVS